MNKYFLMSFHGKLYEFIRSCISGLLREKNTTAYYFFLLVLHDKSLQEIARLSNTVHQRTSSIESASVHWLCLQWFTDVQIGL